MFDRDHKTHISLLISGDSMMYHNSVSGGSSGGGVGCGSGGSPNTSTPPNINSCSSVTPPLSNNNVQNSSHNEVNGDQMVRIEKPKKIEKISFHPLNTVIVLTKNILF